jgi:lipid A 4'-phosphatase
MRKSCLIFIAANVVLGLAFFLYPEFDLRFAGLFFDPRRGFLISDRSALNVVRLTTIVFVNGSLLLLLVNWRRGRRTDRGDYLLTPNRNVIFLLFALGLGPGLLVNGVLKSYWGRARPYDVIQFGGKKEFTPAFAHPISAQVTVPSFPGTRQSVIISWRLFSLAESGAASSAC